MAPERRVQVLFSPACLDSCLKNGGQKLRRIARQLSLLLACAPPVCAQICLHPSASEYSGRVEQSARPVDVLCNAASAVAYNQTNGQGQGDDKTKTPQTKTESQQLEPAVQPTVVDQFSFGHLPMSVQKGPMTVGQKFAFFEKPVFGPRTLVTTAFGAGLIMASTPSGYPHEWRAGAAAFGRNYGNLYARRAAMSFGRFSADALLHEDPRYFRSDKKSFFGRSAHALGYTFIDKSDSGHRTIAFGNFVGAAAAGFVGNAYLPNGWNNSTHAGQRSLAAFGEFGVQNFVQEFSPEIGRAFRRLHLPKLPLPPIWWAGGSH